MKFRMHITRRLIQIIDYQGSVPHLTGMAAFYSPYESPDLKKTLRDLHPYIINFDHHSRLLDPIEQEIQPLLRP